MEDLNVKYTKQSQTESYYYIQTEKCWWRSGNYGFTRQGEDGVVTERSVLFLPE